MFHDRGGYEFYEPFLYLLIYFLYSLFNYALVVVTPDYKAWNKRVISEL